jgi:hypothetical protein
MILPPKPKKYHYELRDDGYYMVTATRETKLTNKKSWQYDEAVRTAIDCRTARRKEREG